MSEYDATLFANEVFYRAFADRDFAAMEEIWSSGATVVCIHPGWTALVGYTEVMASWRRILANRNAPAIACHQAEAFVYGEVAFVVCYEQIDDNFLVATNIFRRENGRWKMVHHQAGPSAPPPSDDDEDSDEPAPRPN
ncbi:MAG: nuclear transport factor 2 family protein [Rhodospirillales bacterium]|nr:nuclear transport factor 2 family protein [Rhodospirillales bacterium]